MTLAQDIPLTKGIDYYQPASNKFLCRMKPLKTRGNFLSNSLSCRLKFNF